MSNNLMPFKSIIKNSVKTILCIFLLLVLVQGVQAATNFVANTTSGTTPLPVSFTDLSSNSPTGWAWYFGDENWTALAWTQVNAGAGWSF